MSYDLMVFDADEAPHDRASFIGWYEEQVKWSEPHTYDDPTVCTPALRAWFLEIKALFPPLNGPYASQEDDNPRVTEYSLGRSVIYAGFGWSQTDAAYRTVFTLAEKHRLGFFDVSSTEGSIWLPTGDGRLSQVGGDSRKSKRLSDETFDWPDFKRQATGGSLRWHASVGALLSLGLLIWMLIDRNPPEIHHPVHVKGPAVYWIVGCSFLLWSVVAVVNWRSWKNK